MAVQNPLAIGDTNTTIDLSDFSPGIFGDYHGGVASTSTGSLPVDGAATIANTFGCCADASGALVPLPAQTAGQTQALMPGVGGSATSAFYPAGRIANYLHDAVISGPISMTLTGVAGMVVSTMWSYWYNSAGAGIASGYSLISLGRAWRIFNSTNTDFWFESSVAAPSYPVGNAFIVRSGSIAQARSTNTSGTFAYQTLYPHLVCIAPSSQNTHAATATAMASPETTFTTFDTDIKIGTNALATYPTSLKGIAALNDPNAFVGTVFSVPDVATPQSGQAFDSFKLLAAAQMKNGVFPTNSIMCVSHQGRVVWTAGDRILDGNYFDFADMISYTAADDFNNVVGVGGYQTAFVEENNSGTGTLASISADELLVVKNRDGGYLVRGDMNSPTITKLPHIESTAGVYSHAINVPTVGLVYGSRNGVFAWGGGDSSKKLSTQIEGFFWDHTQSPAGGEPYDGLRGRFGYFHPWVCVPNNYLFDIRTSAWWRLSDAASTRNNIPYNIYLTDPQTGKLYAFPYRIDAAQQQVWDTFDPAVLANSYSWQSQPLVNTRAQLTNFHNIKIVYSTGKNANAGQTIAITLTGYDKLGAPITPITTTFTATGANGPQTQIQVDRMRQGGGAVGLSAQNVQVKIVASGNGGPAPKIHSISLGVSAGNNMQNATL